MLNNSYPTVNHNNKRLEENYEEEVWVTNHKLTDWTKFRENLHEIDWISATDHKPEVMFLFLSENLKGCIEGKRVKKEETEVERK